MSTEKQTRSELEHIADILDDVFQWLTDLEREALAEAEKLGPIHGRVRSAQRPWSELLDKIEADRQRELG